MKKGCIVLNQELINEILDSIGLESIVLEKETGGQTEGSGILRNKQ